MRFHFLKQLIWKTGIKFCSKNYALPSPRNEFSCATITISDLAGWGKRVGRSALESFILYVNYGNVPYKRPKQSLNETGLKWTDKRGFKKCKANLTSRWPAAYVIFENVLKEGINIACKAYFAVRSNWTVKKWFQGRGCLPLLIGSRVKRKKPPGLGLIRPVVPCRRKWFITKVFQRFWLKIGNFSIFLS